jgi:hypothetical protein
MISLAVQDPSQYLVPAAILMVAFISWVLTRAIRAETGIDTVIVIVLLFMMVAMLLGPAILYLNTLDFTLDDVVVWEIAVFMSGGMMPIAALIATQWWVESDPVKSATPPLGAIINHVAALRATYIILLVLSEFLMGWTFNLGSGLMHLASGYSIGEVLTQFQDSVTSYWFVFTMVSEMAFTLIALRKLLRADLLKILILQAAVMFLTPTAISSRLWETYSIYIEAGVMTLVVGLAVLFLRRTTGRDRPLLVYTGLFIILNAVMMAGFVVWLAVANPFLLAASLIAQTAIYFDCVLTGAGLGETFHR